MAAPTNAPVRTTDSAIRTGLIAGGLFAIGLLAGILLAGRASAPSPSSKAVSPVGTAASNTPTGAGVTGGGPETGKPTSYPGTVKQVLKDGLLIEAPKTKPDEPTLAVMVKVTGKTVLWANVPKTPAELSAGTPTSLPKGSVPEGAVAVPPPASPDAVKDRFKKVSIALSDFRENDVVSFVTTENPVAQKEVTASEIGWVATLTKPAAAGSPAEMSPDPGGRFGSAPTLPPTSPTTAPAGSVVPPSATPPAAPPPPPAPSGASTTTPSGSRPSPSP